MNIRDSYIHGADGKGVVKFLYFATGVESVLKADGSANYNTAAAKDIILLLADAAGTKVGLPIPTLNQNTSGYAALILTEKKSTNASYYLTFVDSNNNGAAAESVYTDAGIYFNPTTGPTGHVGTLHVNNISGDNIGITIGNTFVALGGTYTLDTSITSSSTNNTIPSSKAVYDAILNGIASNDAMVFKGLLTGGTDAAHTTYTPAANCGWTYKVGTAGYINGTYYQVNDTFICTTDGTVAAISSNVNTVKANWDVVEGNGDYLSIHGGTMDGTLTIKTSAFGTQLVIERNADGASAIAYKSSLGILGYIGIYQNSARRWNSDYSSNWIIADASNIIDKGATIGTSATTIATIAGVNITAKIGSYLPMTGGSVNGEVGARVFVYYHPTDTIVNSSVRGAAGYMLSSYVNCVTPTDTSGLVFLASDIAAYSKFLFYALGAANFHVGSFVVSSPVTALNFVSNIATGTQPYACTSTTLNTNLNADLLDGKHASDFAASSHTHSVKINGSTKTIAAPGGTAVDLGSYLPLTGGTISNGSNWTTINYRREGNGYGAVGGLDGNGLYFWHKLEDQSKQINMYLKAGDGLRVNGTLVSLNGHTHPLSIAADTGTNQITLLPSSKYKLTAGGSTYIFTTPVDTWRNIYTGGTSRIGTGSNTKAMNFASSNLTIGYLAAGTDSGQSGSADYFTINFEAKNWTGATSSAAGTAGYMPGAASADRSKYLRGDGSWIALAPSISAGTENTNKVKITVGGENSSEFTIPYATNADKVDGYHASQFFKLYTRNEIGTSPNFNNPKIGNAPVNGYFEIRTSSETTGESGSKPFNSFGSFINITYSNTIFLLAGNNSNGWKIRGRLAANIETLGTGDDLSWQTILTNVNSSVSGGNTITNNVATPKPGDTLTVRINNVSKSLTIPTINSQATQLVSVSKTLAVSTWTDMGAVSGLDVGTYAIQINSGNVYASGIFTACGGTDSVIDEIPLHVADKGTNTWRPYARISAGQLQMTTNETTGTARTYTIKILKLI